SEGDSKMTILDVIVLLIIAGLCGALGQAISGFSRGGCLVSIALGFVGALLGMWLARMLGLPELFAIQIGTTNFPIVWSIIGSALFVAIIAFISRSRA
ncbi:MAG: GlsB/YeaQ/YmgE family stress response membrane protein, partial [Pyrinomonadaceae bacterium]